MNVVKPFTLADPMLSKKYIWVAEIDRKFVYFNVNKNVSYLTENPNVIFAGICDFLFKASSS